MVFTYDKTGNIETLTRQGAVVEQPELGTPGHFGSMDILDYDYDSGNRLLKVTDTGNSTYGFKDGANQTNEYTYDGNGNMIADANKGITSISYNHLNMPTEVVFNGNPNTHIQFVYDAAGIKQRKITNDNGSITTTDYAGNQVYENGNLKQFYHAEGYVEPDGQSGYQYVYQYRDHLGNIRITYADDNSDGVVGASEMRREQNYYPFGMEHRGYNTGSYGAKNNLKTYQGQEFNEDLGLNTYEWKYRMSDPALGRFWQVDPLAEEYVYNGTYNFAENRVIDGFELEGLEWVDTENGWQYQGYNYGPQPVPNGAVGVAPAGSSPVAAWVGNAPIPQTGQVLNVGGPDGTVQQFPANENGMVELPHSGEEQTGANSSGTYEIDGYTVYGYYNRNDVAGAVEDQFGTPTDVANMINAIAEFNENSLVENPLQIGDMRSPTNGPTNINTTATHHSNNGAFDVRLLGTNGGLPGGTTVNSNNYSSQNTQLFINALGNNGFTRFLIGPNAVNSLNNSGSITVQNGGAVHNNHYHIDVD
ncbi:RHS repeat-associated core domain-containing protein [Ascidiimonas aurantiaca]|uniref:RHS repeat-associated core domain-containing protein n=1 Tax=Ascidiimonas aurantiaca TaxID=1685432 RepID=UPI0030ED1A79